MFNIFDSHNDLLFKYNKKQEIINYLHTQPANVRKIFCAYFSYNNSKNASIDDMLCKFNFIKGVKSAVPAVENCWFLNYKNLEKFILAMPFCATLSHNLNNSLCGGAMENGELTSFGCDVVKQFEKNNIFIDTAHMNEKSFWQFCKLTNKPIFNSHTGFSFVYKHNRNLSDNQINEIVKSGGYIGFALYPKFFTQDKFSSKEICEIILKFWDKFGTKTLGFGTDFNGIEDFPEDVKSYEDMNKIAENLKNFGVKNENIKDLFYGNLQRFMLKNRIK